MSALAELAEMATGPLPADLLRLMPARVLDILGICVRATTLDTSQAVAACAFESGGAPQAGVVGLTERLPAGGAAFVNGVLAHSLDYDDTHLPSILHPSASIVPAALAAAEKSGCGGVEVAKAVAVGSEVCVRLGMAGYDPAARQSIYFERGQHATSICGAVGAAAAVSRVRGQSADVASNAMAIACSMAGGVLESNRTGGSVKRLHCGLAARAGVCAADLAERGITGSPSVIEGRFGLLMAFLGDSARPEAITDGLGERWEAENVFFKPYPANHFTHAGIDAALALRLGGLRPEQVEKATLAVPPPVLRTIGEPIHLKRSPQTGYAAQFSGPYAVAAALLGGGGLGVGLEDFTDEKALSPQRRELMRRVDVVGDDSLMDVYPQQFPAILSVTTFNGRSLVERRLANRGGPLRPLSGEELARKFSDNTAGLLPPVASEEVVERLASPDSIGDVGSLMQLLADMQGCD